MATEYEPAPQLAAVPARRAWPAFFTAPFYGWWVLLSLSLLRVVASAVGNNIRSLLILPLEHEFGASRAEISLMATMGSVAIAVTGPLGGWLMDRYGMRQVMFISLLVTGLGYLLLAAAQSLWQVIFIFTLPLGLAYNWAILNSGAPILNNWFERRKAVSLSLLNVGHGAGALLLPLMALTITGLGWRPAMIIAGVILTAFGLLAVAICRDSPEEMGMTPDGDPEPPESTNKVSASLAGASLRQAMFTPYFWAISLGSACMLTINLSIVFHLVPLIESRGESEGIAATLLSLQLFLTVPIVLGTAWFADRFGGTKVLAGMMVCTLMGVLVLLAAHSLPVYVLAMALLAFGGSNWPALWAVMGHMYGRRNYNSIRMTSYSILTAGIAIGPLIAGMTYDSTHSYDLWLRILLGVGVAGILAFVIAVQNSKRRAY